MKYEESPVLELKEQINADFKKEIIAFANADGGEILVGVARGRKKGIKQLVEYYKKNVDPAGPGRAAVIGHADCPKDAGRLKDLLLKEDPNLLVLECSIGPVIGSHVGPEMLAVVFWGQDKRDNLSVADRIARKVKGEK